MEARQINISAEFEPAVMNRRQSPRAPVSLDAKLGRGGLDRTLCRITDLSPEGARISAVLTGGDSAGYRITGAGAPLIATSGTEFDVRTYATAYSGQEHLQIAPVSQTPGATPTILFQIVPVG